MVKLQGDHQFKQLNKFCLCFFFSFIGRLDVPLVIVCFLMSSFFKRNKKNFSSRGQEGNRYKNFTVFANSKCYTDFVKSLINQYMSIKFFCPPEPPTSKLHLFCLTRFYLFFCLMVMFHYLEFEPVLTSFYHHYQTNI